MNLSFQHLAVGTIRALPSLSNLSTFSNKCLKPFLNSSRKFTILSTDSNSPFRDPKPLIVVKANEEDGREGEKTIRGAVVAGISLLGVAGGLACAGYVYRDQINDSLVQFSGVIEDHGPVGYAIFIAAYSGLEILAIPTFPMTLSSGLVFGSLPGTIIVSISGTIAAAAAFVIARYFLRENILKFVKGNKNFLAIDKAVGKNSFAVVALLRLSPLFPSSLANYLYGLTSVKFTPYILGSWLGMLPGTWACVTAGALGRAAMYEESDASLSGSSHLLALGLGFLATGLAAAYVKRITEDVSDDGKDL